ncbi:hypothetical protein DM02DRAFT_645002 [Periconia macrospinosa]|uniref:Basic proline-rich protein n=1 Tax=Periconia macrospinosa TaxID=97972 RepID=A0A2V1DD75_9PLEO|nr:hypothetical protein DM02DRAFT_645002 [Periconia macrospinosa]
MDAYTYLHPHSTSQALQDPIVHHLVTRLHAMTTVSPVECNPIPTAASTTPFDASSAKPHRQPATNLDKQGTVEQNPPVLLSEQQLPPPAAADKLESTTNHNPVMGKTITSASPEARRPTTPRSQTDPSSPSSSFDMLPTHTPRARNRSPYSRSHFRSHSGSSPLAAPPMTRAHSLPTAIGGSGYLALSPSPMPGRPSSPLRSPKRTRSPRSQPAIYEDSYAHSGAPSVCDISEDAELKLVPQAGPLQPSPLAGLYSTTGSLSRRRRPASPLHQVSFGGSVSTPAARTPTSGSSSPLLSSAKFNEPFPTLGSNYPSSLTSSSVPSTPTSMRSRSPSISSLETIPDSPDAEEEAIEIDRIAKLKAAADKESEGAEGPRRSSLDVPGGSGRTFGFGKRDARKRWSVCGAERRQDLDLETIWED